MNMTPARAKLQDAETKALALFNIAEQRGLFKAGKTEKDLNTEIFDLAKELYGIDRYWHKRIVRAGANTLFPYDENPPDLTLQADDILFIDFGPIFEEWEADFGRTYVIGTDAYKLKLKNDTETVWYEVKKWFDQQTESLKASDLFNYAVNVSKKHGWEFGGEIAGHLIGQFPHERLEKGNYSLYVHPENPNNMFDPDKDGNKREWILEIHLVDRNKKIGGFFEQLLT